MGTKVTSRAAALLIFIGVHTSGMAQQSHRQYDTTDPFGTAIDLYQKENYGSAFIEFDKLSQNNTSIYRLDATYFRAAAAMKLQNEQGVEYMESFLQNFPESKYESKATFQLGLYFFENQKADKAQEYFAKVEADRLAEEDRESFYFHKGVCAIEEQNTEDAKRWLEKLEDEDGEFYWVAQYYVGHIAYSEEEYDTALEIFKKLEKRGMYSEVISHYIAQVYYRQKQYDKVITYANPLLEDADGELKGSLAKLIGDAYYMQKEYKSALEYHEIHRKESKNITAESHYIYGYCNYIQENITEAVVGFTEAARGEGIVAQNGSYHLAKCYLFTEEKKKALQAFRIAADSQVNATIQEDALFNFAKLSYELAWSPFNEAIKAFDEYITKYPNSQRNDEAYDYLVKVFMTTKNYNDALSTLDKIQVKSKDIQKAYQRVAFYRGLELYQNGAMKDAIAMFDLSLQYGDRDGSTKAKSLYWKGEAQFQEQQFKPAIQSYKKMLVVPGSYSTNVSKNTNYSLGYAYFKLENYTEAKRYFDTYIIRGGTSADKISDAYNRIGDCYFVERDYTAATAAYKKAYNREGFDADYALFQLAFCAGLKQDQYQKVNELNRLVQSYPHSKYLDDAYFEQGRAWERLNNWENAIDKYETILNELPESNYTPSALLQLGLINYNQNNNEASLAYYKQLIEKYPNSKQASNALNGIKNNYVDLNQVDQYFSYTKKKGHAVSVTANEQDSLTFLSAERQYMAQNPDASHSLKNYLKQYPKGSFALSANYYLGDLNRTAQNDVAARPYYQYVVDAGNNIFSEPALEALSDIVFTNGDIAEALPLFQKLETAANQSHTLRAARLGMMRCHYLLKEWDEAVFCAQQVKETEKVTQSDIREANFTIATSYHKNDEISDALTYYKDLAQEVKTKEGAESKYWICQILYSEKHYEEAESEVMSFIELNTPHQMWLGKSFIVLAKVYHQKNDAFQAEYTLKSLIDNYESDTDDVKQEATKLLDLYSREQQAELNTDTIN